MIRGGTFDSVLSGTKCVPVAIIPSDSAPVISEGVVTIMKALDTLMEAPALSTFRSANHGGFCRLTNSNVDHPRARLQHFYPSRALARKLHARAGTTTCAQRTISPEKGRCFPSVCNSSTLRVC